MSLVCNIFVYFLSRTLKYLLSLWGLILKLIRSNGLGQSIEQLNNLIKYFNLFLVSIFCNVKILKNLSTTVHPEWGIL